MQYVKVNPEDKSRGRDILSINIAMDLVNKGQTVGVVMEDNMYLLDLDAQSPKAVFVAEYIVKKYPDIIAFKTPKAGGYHFLFRSPVPIKAGTGFTTIFGFPMDIKKGKGHAILPDNYPGRSYFNGARDIESFDDRMKEYNVFITPQELKDLIPYAKDVPNPVDLTALPEGMRNDTIFKWLCRWARFRGAKELDEYAQVISKIAQFPLKEIRNSIKSIDRYVQEDQEYVVEQEVEGMIVGKDLLELSYNMLSYLKRTRYIEYDICTGNYQTSLKMAHRNEMNQLDMWNYFRIYFKDKARFWKESKKGEVVFSPITEEDLKNIFALISKHCTINSRRKVYDDIPEWDGTGRILNFMHDYYDCDARPTFFLLLMTAIVGKLKDPEECYVPFFFDLVGNKGTGKSLLFRRLLGEKYYTVIQPTAREDDVCSNIYTKGAVLAVDDECILTQGKGFAVWSEDKLKNFVTLAEDVFSRKYQNVEYHPRGFILCRTSNMVNSATDADERRQIIFESRLRPRECRIHPDLLPDSFFVQMLAEAKAYYEKNGVYKMTQEDWDAVAEQQAQYVDEENIFACEINEFLGAIFEGIKKGDYTYCSHQQVEDADYCTTWAHYNAWVNNTKQYGRAMSGRLFWKNIRLIEQKTGISRMSMTRVRVGDVSKIQVALIYPEKYNNLQNYKKEADIAVKVEQEEFIDELPDLEY